MTLPCIICGAVLESVLPANGVYDGINQPYGGTTFHSGGQYGSTVWDPMSEFRFLELNICDPCLVAAGQRGAVKEVVETPRSSEFVYKSWSGGDEKT